MDFMEDDEMRRLNEIVAEIKDAKTIREVKLYKELVARIVRIFYSLVSESLRRTDRQSIKNSGLFVASSKRYLSTSDSSSHNLLNISS